MSRKSYTVIRFSNSLWNVKLDVPHFSFNNELYEALLSLYLCICRYAAPSVSHKPGHKLKTLQRRHNKRKSGHLSSSGSRRSWSRAGCWPVRRFASATWLRRTSGIYSRSSYLRNTAPRTVHVEYVVKVSLPVRKHFSATIIPPVLHAFILLQSGGRTMDPLQTAVSPRCVTLHRPLQIF